MEYSLSMRICTACNANSSSSVATKFSQFLHYFINQKSSISSTATIATTPAALPTPTSALCDSTPTMMPIGTLTKRPAQIVHAMNCLLIVSSIRRTLPECVFNKSRLLNNAIALSVTVQGSDNAIVNSSDRIRPETKASVVNLDDPSAKWLL